MKDDFIRFNAQYLEQIPVPAATPEQKAEIEGFVQRVLDAKDADVSALEAEIDRRVEHLYFGDAANRGYDEARAEAAGRVRALLRNGRETPTLEFKETFAGGIAQARDADVLKEASWTAICAFLNAAGGDLLIGVDDRAGVAGLDGDLARAASLDKLVLKVESAFGTKLRPNPIGLVDIEPVEIDGKTVLHVRVKGDPSQIYEFDGKVFVRRNAASRPALSATETARWWELRKAGKA